MEYPVIHLLRCNRVFLTGWNIAIAVTKQSEKEGSAGIDLIQADIQGSTTLGLLLGDTPAEIHVDQLDMSLEAAFLEFREYYTYKMVTFYVHIFKGAADKYSNCSPSLCH